MSPVSPDQPLQSQSACSPPNSSYSQNSVSRIWACVAEFEKTLQQIGQLSPEEFATRFQSGAKYLPQISWDVTTAKFWNAFEPKPEAADPEWVRNRRDRFRLNEAELEKLKQYGFVVSERLGSLDFTSVLYDVYSSDLPIFISTDAILHAWHRSYDAVLEELEEVYLFHTLKEMLEGMASGIAKCYSQCSQNDILAPGLMDVDYFLAVAQWLLIGKPVKTVLNQDKQVSETLKAIKTLASQSFPLFGRERSMDFSQFKVRGHYENSAKLRHYFQAMMWCGTVDLRVAGDSPNASLRELSGAIIFHHLLKQASQFEAWQQFDNLIQTFVGVTDSMTFAQLDAVLRALSIKSLEDVATWDRLRQVQQAIAQNNGGTQAIAGHPHCVESGAAQRHLPHAFTVMGQKFVFDSWVMSNVVFDRVSWDGNKVRRRIPSCLDVAFAVFANDQVA